MVVAVNVTMTTLEVMTVERQKYEDLRVTRTGPQPFSINIKSPGFRLLVQCWLTPQA